MNLLQLQQRLIEFTKEKGFKSLESFGDEFHSMDLKEFERFVAFKEDAYLSKTLFRTEIFEIRLLCWKPFQQTPKHPHPQNGCLIKIIEGKLIEEKFINSDKIEAVYKKGDVSYINALEFHVLKNSDLDSISLHIYAPSGFYDAVNKL